TRADLLDGGSLAPAGGAMFRVVPRALSERRMAPAERNRVRLAMRPTLARTGARALPRDTGTGPQRRHPPSAPPVGPAPARPLEEQRADLGLSPGDVDLVVLTHLHFDRAGGLLRADGAPRFPRARVVVQRQELEDAGAECPLCKASYVQDDWRPLLDRI